MTTTTKNYINEFRCKVCNYFYKIWNVDGASEEHLDQRKKDWIDHHKTDFDNGLDYVECPNCGIMIEPYKAKTKWIIKVGK